MVKKRAASRGASGKPGKKTATKATARKKTAKKPTAAKKSAVMSRMTVVVPGAAYQHSKGVDLRPLKKAIRLSIERLAYLKESPKVAAAIESLVSVQQRLSSECTPTMEFPNS